MASASGLTAAQVRLLSHLGEQRGWRLAGDLGLLNAHQSTLDALRRRGLVEESVLVVGYPGRDQRRPAIVRLSETGRAALAASTDSGRAVSDLLVEARRRYQPGVS